MSFRAMRRRRSRPCACWATIRYVMRAAAVAFKRLQCRASRACTLCMLLSAQQLHLEGQGGIICHVIGRAHCVDLRVLPHACSRGSVVNALSLAFFSAQRGPKGQVFIGISTPMVWAGTPWSADSPQPAETVPGLPPKATLQRLSAKDMALRCDGWLVGGGKL